MIDETHDPAKRSWVPSANLPDCDFPIQNLPLGVFRTSTIARPRLGVAIGDSVLDLSEWLGGETLNGYLSLPASQRRELRRTLSRVLEEGSPVRELVPQRECQMLLPAKVGDYTDFYASLDHATNVGRMFRPDNPLLPNYKHVPIAYHGRASSLIASGGSISRPNGQLAQGRFGPSQELDYEVEIGALLGPGNTLGEPIPINRAEEHIAGLCLLNDWSARDMQRWEYQPLGPFLAKNFATSLSGWMVTIEALEPFRVQPSEHDVPVLAYLQSSAPNAFAITLEVWFKSRVMSTPSMISRASFASMYWTLVQMVAHHTANGCALRAGDLIGSGTVSGPEKANRGCLLELTWKGTEPLALHNGETRRFLEDGDEISLRGYCTRDGYRRIGLGQCVGQIAPAIPYGQT